MKRLGPMLATNHGAVYATDCFNVFAALKSDSIDCVFADPPFNLKKDYGRGAIRDDLAKRDYLKWSFAWIDECVRLPIPACRHCGKDIKDYGGHRKYLNPLGLNLTDFWDDTAPARHQKFKARWHINELKPMIPGRCIEIATQRGSVVLDPFGGGGSTYEAAEQRGRYWLGSEITTAAAIRDRFQRRFPGTDPSFPEPLTRIFSDPDPRFRIAIQAVLSIRLGQPCLLPLQAQGVPNRLGVHSPKLPHSEVRHERGCRRRQLAHAPGQVAPGLVQPHPAR